MQQQVVTIWNEMTTSNVTSNNEMTPRNLVIVIRKLCFLKELEAFDN